MTPEEKTQLNTLRYLEEKARDAFIVFDRFGRREDEERYEHFKAQIAALPEAVRQAAAREDELKRFVSAVEKFIIARTGCFLPDLKDLSATVLNLSENASKLEAPVWQSLVKVRALQVPQEDIEIALLLAADLSEARLQQVHYVTRFKDLTIAYLEAKAAWLDSSNSSSLPEPDDLALATREWQAFIPQYRAEYESYAALQSARDPSQRLVYARFMLMRQIAILHRLDKSDEQIDALLFDTQTTWESKQTKK